MPIIHLVQANNRPGGTRKATQGTTMNITLKKVYINERFSEETTCFEATVCIDGKPVFVAKNAGRGGCDDIDPITWDDAGRKLMRESVDAIEAYAKTLPPVTSYGMTLPMNMELIIADMVEKIAQEKAEKALRTRITKELTKLVIYKVGDKFMQAKITPVWPLERLCTHMTAKYPGCIILNKLPFDQAFALLCPRTKSTVDAQ